MLPTYPLHQRSTTLYVLFLSPCLSPLHCNAFLWLTIVPLRIQDLANHSLSLEPRWFYDPDQDADVDRATLVRSMMRRPGKRSETKKAKQYYWRPLPKISRWDAEDEL